MIVPLTDHIASAARQGYRSWIKIPGPPRRLYCDLGREFQKQFEDLAEGDGTETMPSSDPARKLANAFWRGPARVVAVQLPTTAWISYNHHLAKAAPEKLRPAAEKENLSIQ